MSLYYFDANAQVKYHLAEPGSSWVRTIVDATQPDGRPSHTLFATEISLVEVGAALASIERSGQISTALRERALQAYLAMMHNRYQIVSVRQSLLMSGVRLTQIHPLKGYDAVHLATALEVSQMASSQELSLTFVSGDQRLLKAARAEGLPIENPFDYVAHDLAGMTARELAHAIWQLGGRADPAAVPFIIPCLQHTDGNVRRMAASALGKIGSVAAVPALIDALQDAKPQVRQYAAKALGVIGDASVRVALGTLSRTDPKDYVRKTAQTALNSLKGGISSDNAQAVGVKRLKSGKCLLLLMLR